MASHMAMFYGLQAAQVNEELTPKSSLYLTLMQDLRDGDPKPQKVRVRLEVDPPWAWYYHISPNSRTLVILLQVDLIFGDKFETVCEGC